MAIYADGDGLLAATVISEYGVRRLVLDVKHARVMQRRVVLSLRRSVLEAGKRGSLRLWIHADAVPPGRSKGSVRVQPGDTFSRDDDVSIFDMNLTPWNDTLDDVGQSFSGSDADRPFRRFRSPRLRHGGASIAALPQRLHCWAADCRLA